jgi:hypothetical protein
MERWSHDVLAKDRCYYGGLQDKNSPDWVIAILLNTQDVCDYCYLGFAEYSI